MDYMIFAAAALSLLGLGGFIIYAIWESRQYKIHVVIKELTDGVKLIHHDKARIRRRGNSEKLWLKKLKLEAIFPEDQKAYEITNKGKKNLTGYLVEGEFHWLVDETCKHSIECEFTENKIMHYPLTTDQREIIINGLKEAELRKKKGFLDKYGGAMIQGFIMIVLLGMFLIFIGDAVEPMHRIGDGLTNSMNGLISRYENITESQRDITRLQHEIMASNQDIPSVGTS